MTESAMDNDRERRAMALNLACAIHKDLVRIGDKSSDHTPGQVVLADAKAFEAYIRTGRIPASHQMKATTPEEADG
jgi:hypothetical protein